jgi:hypothetical protein
MVVAPVDASGAIGLAGAQLVGVVAACIAYLAYFRTEATVCLDFHREFCFQEQIETADAVAVKKDAVSLRGPARELQHQSGAVPSGLGKGRVRAAQCAEQSTKYQVPSAKHQAPETRRKPLYTWYLVLGTQLS